MYMSFLTDLESTIWNWSCQSATFLDMKSPIWHIESQGKNCDLVTQIWKQLHNAHCLKLTPRCMAFWVGGPLQKVHQGLCIHCTATQWTFGWRRGQQEVRVSVTFRRCLEGFWGIETGMHDSSCFGFHWLHQTVLVRDWCIQGWIRGSAVAEAGRWTMSPCCLMQQSPYASWKELSLN